MRLFILLLILFSTTSINYPSRETMKYEIIDNPIDNAVDSNHLRELLLELENNKLKLYELENQLYDRHINPISRASQ